MKEYLIGMGFFLGLPLLMTILFGLPYYVQAIGG